MKIMNVNCKLTLGVCALLASITWPVSAATKKEKPTPAAATAPATFAPMPADHELAGVWNDPDFTRRLMGSYGFASDVEPRMKPEEQVMYREKIVPLLTNSTPTKAMAALQAAIKPDTTPVFDFTLGNLYFQNDDLTNAIKYFE